MKGILRFILVCLVLNTWCTQDSTARSYNYTYFDWKHEKTGHVYLPRVQSNSMVMYYRSASDSGHKFIGQTKTEYNRKGKTRETEVSNFFYDEAGQLTKFVVYEDNKLEKAWDYSYNEKGELVLAEGTDEEGNKVYRIEQVFGEHGLKTYRYYKKSKEYRRIEYEYSDVGKMSEQRVFKYNKLIARKVYEFEGDKHTRTTAYNKRGKVAFVWLFTCDPRGDEVKKSDTTTLCVNEEALADGGKMSVYLSTDEKGKTTKRIYYYNAEEKMTKYEYFYQNSDLLLARSTYKYENGEMVKYEYNSFYKSGNPRSHNVEQETEEKTYTSERYYFNKKGKEKRTFKVQFSLNNNMELKSMAGYNQKGRKLYEYVYSYQ